MDDFSGVQKLQSLCELVQNEAIVRILEDFLSEQQRRVPYGIVKVCLHELEDKVQILVIFGPDDLVQFYDVGVVEFLQEDDFPEGSLGIGGVLESIENLFEGEGIP